MNRNILLAGFSIVVLGVVSCGDNPVQGDNGANDVVDLDEIVTVDMIQDDGVFDVGRDVADVAIDLVVPDTHVDASDTIGDGMDADVEPIDVADNETTDVTDNEVCVGPECYPPCEDDGVICTELVRNDTGECVAQLLDGFCFVDGACYFNLQPDPENECLFCDPAVSQSEFSAHAGLPCDDTDPCTAGDFCDADGVCVGGAGFGCDDDNSCTIDQCNSIVGCINTPRAAECDDDNACTYQDQCNTQTGVCRGTTRTCNDGNDCTSDYCDPYQGCVYEPVSKACNDYDGCTVNDWCSADGVCTGVAKNCDDGIECTNDSCMGGICLNDWHYGSCNDGDACTDNDFCNGSHVCAGTPKVSCTDYNPCTTDYCDSALGCVNEYNHDSCEPASACQVSGVCSMGVCVGQVRDCEDGNLCTVDSCDPVTGCRHVTTSGICDDHNACSVNENCSSGECLPPVGPSGVTNCDDLNDCTADNCDPYIGCVHEPQAGECEDSNPCSLTGTGYCQAGECISNLRDCDDNQPCTFDTCDGSGLCIHPGAVGGCDDSNECTSGEVCTAGQCAGGSQVNCDDTNICTLDACNTDYGCVYTPTPGNCNDSDVCTINDLCGGGVCGGTQRVCEDYNYCTDNHCDKASGCYFDPNSITCNDYNVCTYDDVCGAGECNGISMFSNPAAKAATLTVGKTGNRGQAVDVDDDPTTCTPKGYCIEGGDNALSELEWLFNPEMLKAVSDGSYSMLLESEGLKTNGTRFTMNLYFGARIDPVSCDPTTSGCNYGVYESSLQNGCDPVNVFDNAAINGTKLTAGGAAYTVPIRIVFGDYRVPVNMYRAKIKASVSVQNGVITSGSGAIGGALVVSELIAAVNSIPESGFPRPYVKAYVIWYLNDPNSMKPDIDLDGDGVDEAVSVGLPFSLVTGNLIEPVEE